MSLRTLVQAHKMYYWLCIVLMLFPNDTVGLYLGDEICDMSYIGCNASSVSDMIEYRAAKSQRCSMNDVTDDVYIFRLVTVDRSIKPGVLAVNFSLPNVECKYEVTLLVNPSITSTEECNNSIFHTTNAWTNEVHTAEKYICVLPPKNSASVDNCQNAIFDIGYTNVFPGCYALRFTVDETNYTVRGSTIIRDINYNRTEAAIPDFQCSYKDMHDAELSENQLRFELKFTVHASITKMRLSFVPQHLSETKGNACQYSQNPLNEWDIYPIERHLIKNCTLFEYGTSTRLDCELVLRVPQNVTYCFQLVYFDGRCNRQTIWNPPPDSAGGWPACTWPQRCTRTLKNNTLAVVQQTNDDINSSYGFLLPIAITVIVIIIIVTGTILYVCRSYSRYTGQRIYVNTNMRNLKISRHSSEVDSVETTDDETIKESNNGDESDAIILLYARGSPTFMSLMADFREILRSHCNCHVHDWYAASEWDAVATVGPSAWVADLLRKKHRALWIDTPKARTLIDMQWKNNLMTDLKRPYERCFDEEAISDFRDIALPSVLDLAKRNVTPEPALQYSRHFVARLEGFDASNRNEDPFEDLSPHTRYLIPHHLSELCSHISSWRTNVDTQRLKTEEAQFRERLIRLKTNNETG